MSDAAKNAAAGVLIRAVAPWLGSLLAALLMFAWPLVIVIAFAMSWADENLCGESDGYGDRFDWSLDVDVVGEMVASEQAQLVREIIDVGNSEPVIAQQALVVIAFAHQAATLLGDDAALVGVFGLDDTWGDVEMRRNTRQAAQRLYETIAGLDDVTDSTPASLAAQVMQRIEAELLVAVEGQAVGVWQIVTLTNSGELGCFAGFSLNSDGPLNLPVLGVYTSHPGPRVCYVNGVPQDGSHCFHAGLDIAAPCGTPIVAAERGTVSAADWSDGDAGWYVRINHPGLNLTGEPESWDTSYWHQQSAPLVQAGQVVARGQIIGYVGDTGNSAGCHLHLVLTDSATKTIHDAADYFGNILKEIR